jgi:hypothetical protein
MARRASDQELLVGALHARIERWLEQEGVFTILGFGDVELAASWTGSRPPGRCTCGGWTTARCCAPTSR